MFVTSHIMFCRYVMYCRPVMLCAVSMVCRSCFAGPTASPSCCGSVTHSASRSADPPCRSDPTCSADLQCLCPSVMSCKSIMDVLQARDVRHSSCSEPISTSVNMCRTTFECLHAVSAVDNRSEGDMGTTPAPTPHPQESVAAVRSRGILRCVIKAIGACI